MIFSVLVYRLDGVISSTSRMLINAPEKARPRVRCADGRDAATLLMGLAHVTALQQCQSRVSHASLFLTKGDDNPAGSLFTRDKGQQQGNRISEHREKAGKVGIIPTCALEFSSQ